MHGNPRPFENVDNFDPRIGWQQRVMRIKLPTPFNYHAPVVFTTIFMARMFSLEVAFSAAASAPSALGLLETALRGGSPHRQDGLSFAPRQRNLPAWPVGKARSDKVFRPLSGLSPNASRGSAVRR